MLCLPEQREGIFKTAKDLFPSFKLQSGRASIYRFTSDGLNTTLLRVEPEVDDATLGILNTAIGLSSGIDNMSKVSAMLARGIPTATMLVNGSLFLNFEGTNVAMLNRKSFEINSEYFLGDTEIVSRTLKEPAAKGDSYAFEFYRRQISWALGQEQLLTVRYEFPTKDLSKLNSLAKQLSEREEVTEADIRKLINVRLKIEPIVSLDNGEGNGGENIQLGNPRRDDDGSGVKV